MRVWLAVALGGFVGAPLRYHLDRVIQRSHDSVFPWGTLVVNAGGSLVVGLLLRVFTDGTLDAATFDLLGIGLCGALTTYSTFGYETLRLVEDGAGWPAVGNVAANLLAGLGAAFLGWLLGGAF